MKSLQFIDRRAGYLLSAFALLLATVAPAFLTTTVSAGQILDRSIKMSTSAASATSVSYELTFTPDTASGALVLNFCSNSPLVGASCTAPGGFSATAISTSTSGYTAEDITANEAKVLKSSGTWTADTPLTLILTGITNPNSNGTFYVRLLTYANDAAITAQYTDPDTVGTYVDDGGIALSINNTIGVQAAVLESMTFCVSGGTIGVSCGSGVTAPNLELGELSGSVKALSSSAVSTGTVYTQISTNASSGAVVRMKSSATSCGGLLRSGGGAACNITASGDGISAGQAEFGVKTSGASGYSTAGATNPTGTLDAINSYNASTYLMNYAVGNATGVTSPYGDDFLDTNDAPVNNQNMDLTFGASISPNTPAGLYTADITLIAAGKF